MRIEWRIAGWAKVRFEIAVSNEVAHSQSLRREKMQRSLVSEYRVRTVTTRGWMLAIVIFGRRWKCYTCHVGNAGQSAQESSGARRFAERLPALAAALAAAFEIADSLEIETNIRNT